MISDFDPCGNKVILLHIRLFSDLNIYMFIYVVNANVDYFTGCKCYLTGKRYDLLTKMRPEEKEPLLMDYPLGHI